MAVFHLIIPASGSGIRFGSKTPKQFLKIDGTEILILTLSRFLSDKRIKSVFISAQKKYIGKIENLVREYSIRKVKEVVEGGMFRQDSVYNSFKRINCGKNDRVIVHDAVRPFVSRKLLNNLLEASPDYDCVVPALRLTDTVKLTDDRGIVLKTVPRENLWSIQTPQIFSYAKLSKAFDYAARHKFVGTDEASLMEYAGFKVKVIEGEMSNIKITTRKDLVLK
ncbi:MAG: 2-C-methyl-D-erythritol 4-phosphate cytidylyltransferase [Ignavibacteria bacterium]|nr:2-C-methyl-D-erythritol 4-phosphate cytidylyltransferase [Ignavibacteria bacterium]